MRQSKFRIYLAGACKDLSPEESNKWRQECQNWATWHDDVFMFNPNDYYNYWDKKPRTNKECMDFFLKELMWSDLVLVNLTKSCQSVGTGIEVAMATMTHKDAPLPIIGFYNPDVGGVYPWLREMCDTVYELDGCDIDIEDILDDIYKMYVEG